MSAAAVDTRLARTLRFYQATIGKKAVMAVTGLILFGFLIGHLAGNLQVFLGAEQINAYARTLHEHPGLLWGARTVLLIAVGLHIWSYFELAAVKRQARPQAYVKKSYVQASLASRSMYYSGPAIAFFVIYHLLHFTTGQAHPEFRAGDVYSNMITGFRQLPVAAAYILAMIFIGLHLNHGLWSMFQTMGANHPRYMRAIRGFALGASTLLVLGNISIPVAILLGLVG